MKRLAHIGAALASSWVFLIGFLAVGAVAGGFAALRMQDAFGPVVTLCVTAVAGLVLNRFVFGTVESYLGVIMAAIFGGILMHLAHWALAVPGAQTGCLFAHLLIGLLDRVSGR